MSGTPLREVDRLTVRFGDSTVVDDGTFAIAPGEKFALVGEDCIMTARPRMNLEYPPVLASHAWTVHLGDASGHVLLTSSAAGS